ncbi:hypothetical protein SSP35_01_07720 [Streptomyces sp. NBRC 110611]|uniref:SAV_2336 N-terminal domain-related protein n=1 Tax=Streptomyces sp. NBRC 110611 TaxID=1621259 RepID=UPI000855A585|nr:SAV_2336 N-terminal domain-related protein [Streptomyces sp. NBRC 110611]GAU65431.1 hypothetical protein SSP35_01_07720 [Streptomyces sp. NBRC 110611]
MPPGEPGSAAGPLDELVGRLTAAGVPADARAMADALWLAQWITPDEEAAGEAAGAEAAGVAGGAGADWPDGADPATFRVGPGGPGDLPSAGADPARDGGSPPGGASGEHGADDPALRDGTRRRVAGLLSARDMREPPTPSGQWGRGADPDRHRLGEVAVPIASAFGGTLPLQRALRPVQRYRAPSAPLRHRLDEPATAELSAHAEMIIPVLRGVHRRAAALRLLMDGSSSMAVWEQLLHDLRQVCERVGAFRDVTVHYLHPHGPDVGVTVAPGPGHPPRPADQLHDPTGHHLTLVISDCAGPLWQDGRMQRLLYRWAADAPLAVVQPLPQRMWARTLLPAVPGTLVRRQGPYRALDFTPARRRRQPVAPDAASGAPRERAIPVLSATPSALSSWARLAAAEAGLSLRGAASVVRADHGAVAPAGLPSTTLPGEPARMVREFDQQASPAARLLAVHLSAVPLALPVIQLVQRAMLPQTGPAELAEVLLSGLVVQIPPAVGPSGAGTPPLSSRDEGKGTATGPWYDFVPGVRDELLGRLSAGEAALVLKHCSLYIERTFGRSARNFPAVAVAMLSGSGREPETGQRAVPEPFARVSERVLRRFEPALRPPGDPPSYVSDGPASQGTALLQRYEQDRTVRDLIEAVRLLRAAAERLPPAGTDLARALLHAWARWRQPDALEEAERAARAALGAAHGEGTDGAGAGGDVTGGEATGDEATGDDMTREAERARALIVLGRVAHARARERRSAGTPAEERTALTDAARHLRAACGLMSLIDPRVLESMVLRTEVLRRLAALPGPEDAGPEGTGPEEGTHAAEAQAQAGAGAGAGTRAPDPLVEAERSLTTLLDQWPSGEQVPGEAYAARGAVLLDQARRAAPAPRGHKDRGGSPVPAGPGPAEALAVRAADDLDTAVVLLRRRGSTADRLVCETLLGLAAARELHGGAVLPSVLPTLERAREMAHALDDPALEAAGLRRIAAAQRAVHTRTGSPAALDAAIAALAAALRLTAPDSPEHSALLTERGAALLLRARLEPPDGAGKRLADEAVHVLREALARVSPQDPDLGSHRLLFGRALRLRHERQPSLADLHEADWILELAARGTDVPDAVCAEAWLEVGDVQLLLDRRFGSQERHDRAAACYRRAAAAATRAGSALLAARAHHRRAGVLEITAGPRTALHAYRESWEQWQRAAEDSGPEAQRTRARMRALGSTA